MPIYNFGRNVVYTPKHIYEPRTEQEILSILEKHKNGQIRVQSSGHSWSQIVEANDVLIRMIHFKKVLVEERNSSAVAKVGGGAVLQEILDQIHQTSHYTLPTMGAIKRQTLAGAAATATHGTGNTSISNYIKEVKIACYDQTGTPYIKTISEGEELLAVKTNLGCMGIVIEMVIDLTPKFWMNEVTKKFDDLQSILNEEKDWPQQQFFVLPYLWIWFAYQRKKAPEPNIYEKKIMRRYKLYDYLMIEIGFHIGIKIADFLKTIFGKKIIVNFWKHFVPLFLGPRNVTADSETILTLHTENHFTFGHVEMELFIPKQHIIDAMHFMKEAISYFAGITNQVDEYVLKRLEEIGCLGEFKTLFNTYVHHYPLFFRHILAEDTLIAMNQGSERYSMSLFTFEAPNKREPYYKVCNFIAKIFAKLYSARPHWGKYNPLRYPELEPLYLYLNRFHDICKQQDPNGVFQNTYTLFILSK